MNNIDRLRKLSGITEEQDDVILKKIRKGITNYVNQEKGHNWPFGFEKEMAKFIQSELEKEDSKNTDTKWGEWS